MENKFKLKENLYLEGKKVISYDTVVAVVKEDGVFENGRFSRTTSKHVSFVSEILGLPIIRSEKKMRGKFYKYQLGVKCSPGSEISIKSSLKILNKIKEGFPYLAAISILKPEIPKKDWALLKGTEKIHKDLEKGSRILSRLNF